MSEEERRRICIITGVCPPTAEFLASGHAALDFRAALLLEDLLEEDKEDALTKRELLVRLLERYRLSWEKNR